MTIVHSTENASTRLRQIHLLVAAKGAPQQASEHGLAEKVREYFAKLVLSEGLVPTDQYTIRIALYSSFFYKASSIEIEDKDKTSLEENRVAYGRSMTRDILIAIAISVLSR